MGRWLLAMMICLLALPLQAQVAGLRSLERDAIEGGWWQAVGRLDFDLDRDDGGTDQTREQGAAQPGGQGAFCTGALIAPDLVLSAAHCLTDPVTGRRIPAGRITFRAGLARDGALMSRQVWRTVIQPGYRAGDASGPDKIARDMALFQLTRPITDLRPFELDTLSLPGARLGVVSYGAGRSEAPQLQEVCSLLAREAGAVLTDCMVDFGSSGAPVFSFSSGAPRIVSLVAAKSEMGGQPVAVGPELGGYFQDLMRAIEEY